MNDPTRLTTVELFWLGSLVLLMFGCLVWAARSRDPRAWLQPPLVMTLIYFYYAVAGPLNTINQRSWFDRYADLRSAMVYSWAGACVSFLFFLVGYGLLRQRLRPPRFSFPLQAKLAHDLGQRLNIVGLGLFTLVAGFQLVLAYLNPTGLSDANVDFSGFNLGAFTNYAVLAINLMVPGCLLMTSAWLQRNDSLLPPANLMVWLLVAGAIFTSLGFRWRIAVLAGSLVMLWFLAKRVRPKMTVIIPSILGLLFMAGYVGLARTYGKGINLAVLEGKSIIDIMLAGFSESAVFLTSGGVIQMTPKLIPFAGLTPVINTLLFPIPKALMPFKDSAAYVNNATAVIYNSDTLNSGSVLLNYAEYFLMAGWLGVIFWSTLLGWISRRLWLWYRYRAKEPLAQVIYVVNAAYLYVVVSRGYMPQVVMLWIFTAAPLFLVYVFVQRAEIRALRNKLPRTPRRLLPAHLLPHRSRPW